MSADYLEARVDKFIFRVKPDVGYTKLGVWVAMDGASGIAGAGFLRHDWQRSESRGRG